MESTSGSGGALRLVATVGAVVAVIVALVIATSGGGKDHHIYLVTPSASFFFPGLRVEAAGHQIGEVTKADVTADNQARLKLRIDNDDVWPLPQGTKARLRFAGTVKMSGRYVELDPPAGQAPPLADGAVIKATDVSSPQDYVTSPQEFDYFFGTFDKSTRRNLKTMLDRSGPALGAAAPEVRRALDRSPDALVQARALMEDLGADPNALSTLVRSSGHVAQAVDTANPGIGDLLSGAGTTFAAVARQADNVALALQRMPATLVSVRRTLSHADGTLRSTAELSHRLSPGVAEVRKLASPLNGVLRTLVNVGPDARGTLSALRGATPDLNPFLGKAQDVMPRIESISRQATTQLDCIRPFSPEIANFFVNWTGIWGGIDRTDHFLRTGAGLTPWPNGVPLNSGQLHQLYPGVKMAFPRPPGEIAGQPWFQPQCGITADALDASKDPEATGNDPLSRKVIEFGNWPEGSR